VIAPLPRLLHGAHQVPLLREIAHPHPLCPGGPRTSTPGLRTRKRESWEARKGRTSLGAFDHALRAPHPTLRVGYPRPVLNRPCVFLVTIERWVPPVIEDAFDLADRDHRQEADEQQEEAGEETEHADEDRHLVGGRHVARPTAGEIVPIEARDDD